MFWKFDDSSPHLTLECTPNYYRKVKLQRQMSVNARFSLFSLQKLDFEQYPTRVHTGTVDSYVLCAGRSLANGEASADQKEPDANASVQESKESSLAWVENVDEVSSLL